jgi:hypothetical protein
MSTIDPNNLGSKVTSRDINWADLVHRAWGSEFNAPDHGIYEWSNGRKYDSTDKGTTGLYGVNGKVTLWVNQSGALVSWKNNVPYSTPIDWIANP